MKIQNVVSSLCFISLLTIASNVSAQQHATAFDYKQFGSYWYQGTGEITRYKLEQARYGQTHPGDAVLIFVTEDFLPDKQVKYEGGPTKNKESVMHMNFNKKFNTGLYPYSMMTSVFHPISQTKKHAYKATSSSQEWCGHTYMQLNHRKGKYDIKSHSYFMNEADQKFNFNAVLLEDEVWTKIRINPFALPLGEIEIIPAFQYIRLRHKPLRIEKATVKMSSEKDDSLSKQMLNVYTIEYKTIDRKLEIKFESTFPYHIVAWQEKIKERGQWQTTKVTKTHSLQIDYWNKHNVEHQELRKKLGLK